MSNIPKGYKRVVYPTEKFYIAEGYYTIEEIEAMYITFIKCHDFNNEALEKSMEEVDALGR